MLFLHGFLGHIAEQIHLAVAHSELAIIPYAGHLSNMEQPAEFNAHVRRFCLAAESAADRPQG